MVFVLWLLIILFIAVVVLYMIGVYNKFINLKNNIEKAFSNIDVLLKQRFDELSKLVQVVKGYAKHERETFEQITKARSIYNQAKTINEKIKADKIATDAISRLFAVAENYPTLKANENFIQLQNRISEIETSLANARKNYNDKVTRFNILCEKFPTNTLAKLYGIKQKYELFKATPSERKDVKIEF